RRGKPLALFDLEDAIDRASGPGGGGLGAAARVGNGKADRLALDCGSILDVEADPLDRRGAGQDGRVRDLAGSRAFLRPYFMGFGGHDPRRRRAPPRVVVFLVEAQSDSLPGSR